MASFTATDDLVTHLKTINAANLPNFGTRPIVLKDGQETSKDSSGAAASGIITLGQEEGPNEEKINSFYHNERSIIPAIFYIEKMTSSDDINKLLEEVTRLNRVNNISISRTYDINMIDITISTNEIEGFATCNFVLVKRLVDSTQ